MSKDKENKRRETRERTKAAVRMIDELSTYYNMRPNAFCKDVLGFYTSFYSSVIRSGTGVSVGKFAVIEEKYNAMLKEESIAYDDKLLRDTWEGDEEVEDD